MTRPAPSWLADFQARFGAVVRAPLDRATGTLVARMDAYDPIAVEASLDGPTTTRAERLAVYNRQYWFRLFGVLHDAFPLVCRLVGYWAFNGYAARYLDAHPPRGWDVDAVPDGFAPFFERALDASAPHGGERGSTARDREALVDAARLDAAYRAVFRAPPVTPFRPSREDAAHLLDATLVASPAVAIVVERSALAELRRTILRDRSERRRELPTAWPEPHAIAILRGEEGTAEIPLEAREAELLALLETHPVREALALVERSAEPDERAELPAKTQRWLALSVQRGWWSGMRRASAPK